MEIQGLDLTGQSNYLFCGSDMMRAATDSHAVIVSTEWEEYATCDYS